MENKLWRFTDSLASFEAGGADKIRSLYFPLCNEVLMSSISPDLHGDIKTRQNSFLLNPVSRIDLVTSKSSRNFWIYNTSNHNLWSVTGVSKDFRQIQQDKFKLNAGLLWHKITRENKKIGLRTELISFVPASGEPVEIMLVKITNISSQKINFIPTLAIPIYARPADNLRDHRQVTSLLQRITRHKFGVLVKPTLIFDESGHKPNKTLYFVLGWDEKFSAPEYIYPTQEMFCGEGGDLEAPESVVKNTIPNKKALIQGKEAMGALRFRETALGDKETRSYIILMGITEDKARINRIIHKFNSLHKIKESFEETKKFWLAQSQSINLSTGNSDFDNWLRWVNVQPTLRRIFGCSFLPDFDYGKGGRGWRDLWQDCLELILTQPASARSILVNNFSGVRIDGSNATIIGKKAGEFFSDRNNLSRVWMDHGVWPLLTLNLYLNETGDTDILLTEASYFRNHEIKRARERDINWSLACGQQLKDKNGRIYKGTVLEHLLVQHLVQFFNVGSHNHLRLEGADWNDGLDMARENGESVAFSCMYAYNLGLLSELIKKIGKPKIEVAKELNILLGKTNYHSIRAKQGLLEKYFSQTKYALSGKKVNLDALWVASDLRKKSEWMIEHIRKTEWLKEGFFNGYYDEQCQRVEGTKNNTIRIMLASQVFPIMSGVADDEQIKKILKNTQKYLWDKQLKGYHLNTNLKEEQHELGRAFSFVYGDKENGAFFNHMVVMFAHSLYKRGFVQDGWQVLSSIYELAMDTAKAKIYPCLPEYFNLEGRGMYSYLTGSASWFVLTLLTEVFGIKGKDGDLLIEPKFCAEQFKHSSKITIKRIFAERKLRVTFANPQKLTFGKYRIIRARLNSRSLSLSAPQSIIIPRKTIISLSQKRTNILDIIIG